MPAPSLIFQSAKLGDRTCILSKFTFPEIRRRMRALSDLLYAHYRLRARHAALGGSLPPDFRQTWEV